MTDILVATFGIDRNTALSLSWVGLASTSTFSNPLASIQVPANHATIASNHRNNLQGTGCN